MDFVRCGGAFCAATALHCCVAADANQHESGTFTEGRYDLRRLMQPSAAELASEEKGHVHIYESLEINEVEAALDQNFHRIQNMMFTRIHHLPPTGAGLVEVEDDGCE